LQLQVAPGRLGIGRSVYEMTAAAERRAAFGETARDDDARS
jgi:hypothetical protein